LPKLQEGHGLDKLGPVENFILSVLAFSGVPLLPLLIEWMISGAIADKSLVLTAAIYSAGMLSCTRKVIYVALYALTSILQAALFGALNSNQFVIGELKTFTVVSMVAIFFTQIVERYKMHVTDGRNFWGEQ
jgi:hypothetical protein